MPAMISRRGFFRGASAAERGAPVAAIAESCFAVRGVYCRSCADSCDERAIVFTLQKGGRAIVSVNAELCSGCGECAAICPASAISAPRAAKTSAMEVGHA